MDQVYAGDPNAIGRRRRRSPATAAAAEADLAMRLLIAALVLVLGAVIGASTLVQLGDFRHADAVEPARPSSTAYADDGSGAAPCVRLADADRCVTPAEVAARLVPNRLTH